MYKNCYKTHYLHQIDEDCTMGLCSPLSLLKFLLVDRRLNSLDFPSIGVTIGQCENI